VLERDYLRRGAAEFVGTFALIFVGCAAAGFARSLTDVALAHGLVIAVFVSALGFISGGHFNPAVTLGFLITRRIAPTLAVFYWVIQMGAAVLAALLLNWVLPNAVATASNLVISLLRAKVKDPALLEFDRAVRSDLAKGADAATAAAARAKGTILARGVSK